MTTSKTWTLMSSEPNDAFRKALREQQLRRRFVESAYNMPTDDPKRIMARAIGRFTAYGIMGFFVGGGAALGWKLVTSLL
jgi:hypothetical protein